MNPQTTTPSVLCPGCGEPHLFEPLHSGTIAKCTRCGATIARRTPFSLDLTAAFSLAALILYIPANIFPILRLDMYGATSQNTVLNGCTRLYKDGDYAIATIVFLASFLIPLLKLLALFFLVITTKFKFSALKLPRFWIYRAIETLGRWAMLDVFVLAVLVSLVKLKRLATIIPGPGLLAFALVVIFTILASASFDPELIWERENHHHE